MTETIQISSRPRLAFPESTSRSAAGCGFPSRFASRNYGLNHISNPLNVFQDILSQFQISDISYFLRWTIFKGRSCLPTNNPSLSPEAHHQGASIHCSPYYGTKAAIAWEPSRWTSTRNHPGRFNAVSLYASCENCYRPSTRSSCETSISRSRDELRALLEGGSQVKQLVCSGVGCWDWVKANNTKLGWVFSFPRRLLFGS
jgi:hypothetical protein